MELLSGLILAGVVLAALIYLAKETLGDRISRVMTEYTERPARTPTHHLVGASGTVISEPEGKEGLQRVRIGIERWNARIASPDGVPLPIDTKVRVTAVDGLVLDVEPRGEEESPAESVESRRTSG